MTIKTAARITRCTHIELRARVPENKNIFLGRCSVNPDGTRNHNDTFDDKCPYNLDEEITDCHPNPRVPSLIEIYVNQRD